MMLFIIKKAVKEAKLSDHHHKMGAVIFSKKRIISIGRNYSCRSAKHLHPRFMRWRGSIHAEADAIIKARRDLKGYSMLVVRVNNKDEFRLAMSCELCRNYLKYVSIKDLYYTTNEGTIEHISLN